MTIIRVPVNKGSRTGSVCAVAPCGLSVGCAVLSDMRRCGGIKSNGT